MFGEIQLKCVLEITFAFIIIFPNKQIITRFLSNFVPQILTSVPPFIGPLRG